MKRIHITGSPRSGTTLMLELMATCFKLDVVGKKEISVFADLPVPRPGAIACTKNPTEWGSVPGLLACDPELWFILMVRDPRDVVVSRHNIHPDRYWANLRQWNVCWGVMKQCCEHEQAFLVRYEDLVNNPDEMQEKIARCMYFLESKLPFSRFHERSKPSTQSVRAMHGVRSVSNSSIGVWRRHKPRLAGQLSLHGPVSDVLIELGYEIDDSWLEQLEGVTADTSPGHWPDFVSDEKRRVSLQKLDRSLYEYKRKHGLTDQLS